MVAAALYLHFTRGSRRLALRIEEITAICPTPLIQSIPQAPRELLGLFAHHGRMVALVDCRLTPQCEPSTAAVAIITKSDLGELAFAADTVEGQYSRLDHAEVLSPTAEFTRIRATFR